MVFSIGNFISQYIVGVNYHDNWYCHDYSAEVVSGRIVSVFHNNYLSYSIDDNNIIVLKNFSSILVTVAARVH